MFVQVFCHFLIWLLKNHKQHKQKIDKWTYIELKNLLHIKGNSKYSKKTTWEWEKLFGNHISDTELISKRYIPFLKTGHYYFGSLYIDFFFQFLKIGPWKL